MQEMVERSPGAQWPNLLPFHNSEKDTEELPPPRGE